MSDLLRVAGTLVDISHDVGRVLIGKQLAPRSVDEKQRADLVTDADRTAEEMIERALSTSFPGAHVLMEEGGQKTLDGNGFARLTFVVDPVDGTTNYAAGNPHYAVSIGVLLDDAPVVGVVFDPPRHEMFVGIKNEGAWLTTKDDRAGRRLTVSTTTALKDAVLATGFPYTRFHDADDNHAEFCALNLLTRGCRRNGAATLDLAWVAAARFDGYWERGLKPWDLLAGLVLVEEAGGRTTDYGGRVPNLDVGEVIATNAHVHDETMGVLRAMRPERSTTTQKRAS